MLVMRSLIWATDVDVLPTDRDLLRRDDHWVVRSPSNSLHHWGNLLIFDAPPVAGDGARWEALFRSAFPELDHRVFAWDVTDGDVGAAVSEFPGFELERQTGLIATPAQLHAHPRANAVVTVRALAADDGAWDKVLGLWEANNSADDDPHPSEAHRTFLQARMAGLRAILAEGRGAWFVAEDGGQVVGSLGVIVTDGRARYQSVDTRPSHRGRGIASRLVFDAAQMTAAQWPVDSLVIAAVPDYHALGIYESLGFRAVEQVTGVSRRPPDPAH
jgi:ribosomal protein S18 acetylase RimI-like enzyme